MENKTTVNIGMDGWSFLWIVIFGILLTLKLTGQITYSWFTVFLPIMIMIGVPLVLVLIVVAIYLTSINRF